METEETILFVGYEEEQGNAYCEIHKLKDVEPSKSRTVENSFVPDEVCNFTVELALAGKIEGKTESFKVEPMLED